MDTTCQYCNKSFSTISNLKIHINTNKKCIKNRNISSIDSNNIKVINFTCKFCDKDFSQKNTLLRHLESCKQKEIKEILETVKPITTNINDLSNELANLKEKQLKHEYELNLKDEQLKSKDEQLKSKDEQLKYALKSLEKKEQEYIILLNLLNKRN